VGNLVIGKACVAREVFQRRSGIDVKRERDIVSEIPVFIIWRHDDQLSSSQNPADGIVVLGVSLAAG
jgi:hypothetical protein